MNEVSIIINNTRYDAVESEDKYCDNCDLRKECDEIDRATVGQCTNVCCCITSERVFKKSTKSFER